MNGKPLAPQSADMRAMVAYFDWMKNYTRPEDEVAGHSVGKIDPAIKPDLAKGKVVYAKQCTVCHGDNGQGLARADGERVYPLMRAISPTA